MKTVIRETLRLTTMRAAEPGDERVKARGPVLTPAHGVPVTARPCSRPVFDCG